MENSDENFAETVNATTAEPAIDVIAAVDTGASNAAESEADTAELTENPTAVLDLALPQPSTSSSHSAGAVGAASLVKLNLEETLKKENNTDQNPSTSASANTTSSGSNGRNVLECPICLQYCIHPARLPCGHIFCFLCVKGVANRDCRCAMCRREIPPNFLDQPQLVNGIEDICTTKATDDGYQWFYEGRNGGWWEYEKRHCSEIEEAFQKFLKYTSSKQNVPNTEEDNNDNDGDFTPEELHFRQTTCKVQICGLLYIVDFENMVQYPYYKRHNKRKVCRARGLPRKGVAGISDHSKRPRMQPY